MKASIAESAVSDIRTALIRLPPPKPADRMLRIEEAVAALYDDFRGAILAGHSIASLASSVLSPSGWTASAERIRRAMLQIARQRRDKELGEKIGGLRPRRHRALRNVATTPTATLPTRPAKQRGTAVVAAPEGGVADTKTALLALE